MLFTLVYPMLERLPIYFNLTEPIYEKGEDGMIIDFRVRPPFKGYLKDYLYTDIESIDQYLSPKYGARVSASALHRSLEELVQEMIQWD